MKQTDNFEMQFKTMIMKILWTVYKTQSVAEELESLNIEMVQPPRKNERKRFIYINILISKCLVQQGMDDLSVNGTSNSLKPLLWLCFQNEITRRANGVRKTAVT